MADGVFSQQVYTYARCFVFSALVVSRTDATALVDIGALAKTI